MIGSFSLGNATPNIAALFGAKGGAAVIYEIIDRVGNSVSIYFYDFDFLHMKICLIRHGKQ